MKISIISLKSSEERRRRLAQELQNQALPWEFFDACDGHATVGPLYSPAQALALRGRTLLPGEIGCFRSHWTLWNDVAEGSDEWRMILEDDHLLDPTFRPSEIIKIAEMMKVDYVRLASVYLQKFSVLGVFGGRQFVRFRSGPYGSGAYLLSRSGARKLLSKVKVIVRPVDDEIDCFWINGLPAVAVFPPPTLNIGMYSSSINASGAQLVAQQTLLSRSRWLMNRARRKLSKIVFNLCWMTFDLRCRRLARRYT